MRTDPRSLRDQTFGCEVCAGSGLGFSRVDAEAPLSKFPPTIGSSGPAPLLFVGTNPRISNTNRDLYAEIMRNRDSFCLLAQDVWHARSYLRFGEPGRHYDLHIAIAEQAFPHRPFSAVAAVTELFLCATKDEELLPRTGSVCADLYLDQVARQVCPEVVVTIGAKARSYFDGRRVCAGMPFKARLGDGTVVVAAVPHPAARGVKGSINAYIDWAAEVTRVTISGGSTFPRPPRRHPRPFTQGDLAAWLIYSIPTITAGGLTAELAAAFPPPIYKIGRRHGPHYLSLYCTGKLSVPESDPRDW